MILSVGKDMEKLVTSFIACGDVKCTAILKNSLDFQPYAHSSEPTRSQVDGHHEVQSLPDLRWQQKPQMPLQCLLGHAREDRVFPTLQELWEKYICYMPIRRDNEVQVG